MAKRIRYHNEGEVYKSERLYRKGEAAFRIHLVPSTCEFKVVDIATNVVAAEGSAKTLGALKKKVKETMIGLGFEFEGETRMSKNTPVPPVAQ